MSDPRDLDDLRGSLLFEDLIRCRICGCHDFMACFHERLGPCWWIGEGLCSHCDFDRAPPEALEAAGIPW